MSGREDFLDLDVSERWIVGHEVVLCAFQIGLDSALLAQFGRRLALAKARFADRRHMLPSVLMNVFLSGFHSTHWPLGAPLCIRFQHYRRGFWWGCRLL